MQTLFQSLEGMVFAGIILWRLKSLGRALRSTFSNAYLVFILLYVMAFVIGSLSIQNFGILSRERVMMLPFFFALLAYVSPYTRVKGKKLVEKVPVESQD